MTAEIGRVAQKYDKSLFRISWAENGTDTILLCLLLAGIAWVPFWLGSNRPLPWGVNGLWFPLLTICYELSILIQGRAHPYALRRIALPAGLFCAVLVWIVFQMTELDIPSFAHPVWNMAADGLGTSPHGSISVNRNATALALLRLLTDASVLWLAMQLSRNPARAHLILQAIAVIVAVYSAYGLILASLSSSAIPFLAEPVPGFVRSTFVNRNHFATFAGLGFLATTALIIRLYRHEVPNQEGLRSYRLQKFIEATGRRGWVLLGFGFVTFVALLGTVSRGGILSTGLGLITLGILSVTRQRPRRKVQIEVIIFGVLVLAAAFMFFGGAIVGRVAAAGLEDASRPAVYMITIRSIFDVPLLGFGYGTFADIFPVYRDQSISTFGVWDKAHNTYLEVWQGLGLIFGTALMASLVIIGIKCCTGAIKRHRDASPAIVAAAASTLVGFHALVDFSLQIEAVTLIFMALLGAGLAQSERSSHDVAD